MRNATEVHSMPLRALTFVVIQCVFLFFFSYCIENVTPCKGLLKIEERELEQKVINQVIVPCQASVNVIIPLIEEL